MHFPCQDRRRLCELGNRELVSRVRGLVKALDIRTERELHSSWPLLYDQLKDRNLLHMLGLGPNKPKLPLEEDRMPDAQPMFRMDNVRIKAGGTFSAAGYSFRYLGRTGMGCMLELSKEGESACLARVPLKSGKGTMVQAMRYGTEIKVLADQVFGMEAKVSIEVDMIRS